VTVKSADDSADVFIVGKSKARGEVHGLALVGLASDPGMCVYILWYVSAMCVMYIHASKPGVRSTVLPLSVSPPILVCVYIRMCV
jgi:hypothetical protein